MDLYQDKWESLKDWLLDCSKDCVFYDTSKVYEYVHYKIILMEKGENNK